MAVERRGKKPGGKKVWSLLEKMGKRTGVFFLGLKQIRLNDEVKLTDYFNRIHFNQLPFQPFDLKMFFLVLEFMFLVQFIRIEYKSM